MIEALRRRVDKTVGTTVNRAIDIMFGRGDSQRDQLHSEIQKVNDPNFLYLPDGSMNMSLQIIEPITDEDRHKFGEHVSKGLLQITDNEVLLVGFIDDGSTFIKGAVNPLHGWVISDFPYGRMGGSVLWIAREMAGWADPTGNSGSPLVINEIQIGINQQGEKKKKHKLRNPYVPLPRRR